MPTVAQDPRPALERMVDQGHSFADVQAFINHLDIPSADRDALRVWARAYFELRPTSIFINGHKEHA